MAIQVWNGSEYVGAELARFGATGTLTEALVWDGAEYVKVWPSAPAYPVSGEWGPLMPASTVTVYGSHTIAGAGTYTLNHTMNGGGAYRAFAIFGPWGTTPHTRGSDTITTTQTLNAGDLIEFVAAASTQPQSATGSWSITKI